MRLVRIVALSLALSLSLALAPAAAGREPVISCSLFDTVMAAAPGGFKDLRGEQVQPGVYESVITVPGYSCVVFQNTDSGFLCRSPPWSEIIGKTLYANLDSEVSACFDGWERRPLFEVEGNLVAVDGVRFVKPEITENLAAGFTLFRTKDNRPAPFILAFGVLVIRPATGA